MDQFDTGLKGVPNPCRLSTTTEGASVWSTGKEGELLPDQSRRDPTAAFTDGQWYCYQARQSVYFAAFLSTCPTRDEIVDLTRELLARTPQVAAGFLSDSNATELPANIIDQLVEYDQVDDLNAFPDAWDTSADPLYDRPDLPMFRFRVRVRPDGPDEKGRGAAFQVLSTHALFEGADSASLSRSQKADHQGLTANAEGLPFWRRALLNLGAAFLAPVQIVLAFFLAPRHIDIGFATLTISRDRLRKAATRHNVGQRAFMFALVALALNGRDQYFSSRRIFATYTELDAPEGPRGTDEYFRYRLMEAKFPLSDDFGTFAQTIQQKIAVLEKQNPLSSQAFINALFRTHRWMKAHLPFLYFKRLFRFTGFYDLDLSMVPPHRLGGDLSKNVIEPIYAGTEHPGLKSCIFVPQRQWVTFNFNLPNDLITRVPDVLKLLDEVDPPQTGQ